MLSLLLPLLKDVDWPTCLLAPPRVAHAPGCLPRCCGVFSDYGTYKLHDMPHVCCSILLLHSKPAILHKAKENMCHTCCAYAGIPLNQTTAAFTKSHFSVPRCFRQTTLSPQDELAQQKIRSEALAATVQEKTHFLAEAQVRSFVFLLGKPHRAVRAWHVTLRGADMVLPYFAVRIESPAGNHSHCVRMHA